MTERIRVERVCDLTSLSKRQVQAMAKRGDIPGAAQLGSVWTFDELTIRRWIKAKERGTWPTTSIVEEAHGGGEYRPTGPNDVRAYEQAIGLRPNSGSRTGRAKSATPSSTASRG